MKPVLLLFLSVTLIGPTWALEGRDSATKVSFDAERWMTFYYENPQPDKAFTALRAIHDEGFFHLPNAQRPLTDYIDKIIGTLEYKNERTDPAKILIYGSARFSLASNCRQHKAVLKHCRSIVNTLPETAKAEVQLILDEIDAKAPPSDIEGQTVEKLKQLKEAQSE